MNNIFYPNKACYRRVAKSNNFSPSLCRKLGDNEYILQNATAYRIIPVWTPSKSGYYVIEANVDGEWKFLQGTCVKYSRPENKWFRNYDNAFNRCKKIARKFPEIKMNKLIHESGYAGYLYGHEDPKTIELEELIGILNYETYEE